MNPENEKAFEYLNSHEHTRNRLRLTCERLWEVQVQNAWLCVALMCSLFSFIHASIVAWIWYSETKDCKEQVETLVKLVPTSEEDEHDKPIRHIQK